MHTNWTHMRIARARAQVPNDEREMFSILYSFFFSSLYAFVLSNYWPGISLLLTINRPIAIRPYLKKICFVYCCCCWTCEGSIQNSPRRICVVYAFSHLPLSWLCMQKKMPAAILHAATVAELFFCCCCHSRLLYEMESLVQIKLYGQGERLLAWMRCSAGMKNDRIWEIWRWQKHIFLNVEFGWFSA